MQSNYICKLIVKFNKQQLSDFFNLESSHFESLLTPKIRKFATLF